MRRLGRILFGIVTLTSVLLFVTLAILWAKNRSSGSLSHLGIGRGRFVVELSLDRANGSFCLRRYDKSLVVYRPDAALFRTRGYGWFVSDATYRRFEITGFRYDIGEIFYKHPPVLFQTYWGLEVPKGFLLVATAFIPTLALYRRLRRRRRLERFASPTV